MSVKVAIQVHPFNQRELFLNSICCVEMVDDKTKLSHNTLNNVTSNPIQNSQRENLVSTIAFGPMIATVHLKMV
jgi:hypothetical protein